MISKRVISGASILYLWRRNRKIVVSWKEVVGVLMMRKVIGRAALAMVGLALLASYTTPRNPLITQDELHAQLVTSTAPLILDVRSAAEFRRGHIPGAIHVPFFNVSSRLDVLPAARTQPLVVYCTRGLRAIIARVALRRIGFKQVLYLEGQFAAWRREKLPIAGLPR